MRIAVMAAGAVGGYYGGRMAAAGHDVTFIARGAHRDAIRRDGLKIESTLGNLHLKDVTVADDPKQVGPVDLVLFAVKLWDTETAGEQTRPLVGSSTRVITFQNGVDSVERLAPILGDDVAIAGATYVVTKIAAPGVIRHTGTMAVVRCGRLDRRPDAVLAGYVEQMKTAGIDITLADDMLLDLWKKFVVLSGTSGITASTRQSLGVITPNGAARCRPLPFGIGTNEYARRAKSSRIAHRDGTPVRISPVVEEKGDHGVTIGCRYVFITFGQGSVKHRLARTHHHRIGICSALQQQPDTFHVAHVGEPNEHRCSTLVLLAIRVGSLGEQKLDDGWCEC